MSLRKILGCVLSVLLFASTATLSVDAQDAKKDAKPAGTAAATDEVPDGGMPHYIRPETPEQRRERLGTAEDPGINPDPDKIWWRYGRQYKIVRFDKKWSKYTDTPGYVKPMANVNFVEELYQENEKYVWVWLEEIELTPAQKKIAAEKAGVVQSDEEDAETETEEEVHAYRVLDQKQIDFLETMRPDFAPLDVPKSDVRVRFENASSGLPTDGSWRNSLAVADMNGDGHADIILPPERAGRVTPSIFLGDGKGGWKYWPAKWPARLNYGSVVAADFNKDKKTDLAFGIHLSGIAILLGDGAGNFREVERQSNFPTRRVVATDVDHDGWTDVVAISEGPVMRGKDLRGPGFSNLRAYLNRGKGQTWEGKNIAEPKQRISGDWLTAGDFNGDKYPDFAGSNIYFNGVETMYLSKADGSYEVVPGGNDAIPFLSYYYATTAGRFGSSDHDDAIVTFSRRWVQRVDPNKVPLPPLERVIGIDRISFENGQPKRTPIARWGGEAATYVTGLNHGDFDGDGNEDIVYARRDTRSLHVLLGDGHGGFREATVEGVELAPLRHYDLTVADVNADERPDVVLMYEAESGTSFSRKNGKVDVFLNRGAAKAE